MPPVNTSVFAPLPQGAQIWNRSFTILCWVFGGLGIFLPLGIIGFLLFNGWQAISWDFVTKEPAGFPLGTDGGIWPAIQGSFALVGLGLMISFPLALLGSIYLEEYARASKVNLWLRFLTECLASIPSVLYGVFGYAFLVVVLNLRLSLLAGGVTMALLMFPVLLIGMQEAFRRVDPLLREATLSLGVSRFYLIRRMSFRQSLSGVFAITVLAGGHAFGTTAPVLLTASVVHSFGRISLSEPVMTLPTHLYYLVSEAVSFEYAFATAFVLVMALLLSNLTAYLIKRYLTR